VFRREPPIKLFEQTGCICSGKSPENQPVTVAQMDRVKVALTAVHINQPGMLSGS
jgi:hypothetical protein